MKRFSLFVSLVLSVVSVVSCEGLVSFTPTDDTPTDDISGTPSTYSQEIYSAHSLSNLCDDPDCEPDYDPLPETMMEYYDPTNKNACGFDYDPNATSQFVLRKAPEGVSGLKLLLSREDLFFLAWVSMRHKINPHFLMAVMAQESYGNCAAVSYTNAEGCFQITNNYGRAQLEQSYGDRTASWVWNDSPDGYYPDEIFIEQETWFGEEPETDQFRMTIDPGSETIDGQTVSSVVNFNFGVIASGLYYQWEGPFLYDNFSSTAATVENLISTYSEEKASLMAAAYNGGIGNLHEALEDEGEDYLNEMPSETHDYVERVLYYCDEFQNGSSTYNDVLDWNDVEYIVDLIQITYDDIDVDWDQLKQETAENFFAAQAEISIRDDVKALIYFISTFDVALAPEYPTDINS